MTTRVLPPEEWDRLRETEFGPVLDQLPREGVSILVVEDAAGAVIGCWGLLAFAHVEGLWIAPDHRKRGRVLLRLWQAMCDLARSRSLTSVCTAAVTEDVRDLLRARGAVAMPPHYALPLLPGRMT